MSKEGGVKTRVNITAIAFAAYGLFFPVNEWLRYSTEADYTRGEFVFTLVVAGLMVLAGGGLLARQRWGLVLARLLTIITLVPGVAWIAFNSVVSGFSIDFDVATLVGILLLLAVAIVLYMPSTRAWFPGPANGQERLYGE